MLTRLHYQNGSVFKEKRKKGLVWVMRYRDGNTQPKVIIGPVEKYTTKAEAIKASEFLRSTINRDVRCPRTFVELTDHYTAHELLRKSPYYDEVTQGYLKTWVTPAWGEHTLSEIKAVDVESWLSGLPLAPGTKSKLRNAMHAIYQHAMRWEFFPSNPISLVRQSAKRVRIPVVLTAESVQKLLAELEEPWRTAVYLDVITGFRTSELFGLRWKDFDFEAGEIRPSRGIVRQRETPTKTEESRKPVPLEPELAEVLRRWRALTPYGGDEDFVFASPKMHGKQLYWPNSAMENHIRPAARRAGIERIHWHALRHTCGTILKHQGADVATTKGLMRQANVSITMDRYVQSVTSAKREAQSRIIQLIPFPQNTPEDAGKDELFPTVPTELTEAVITA